MAKYILFIIFLITDVIASCMLIKNNLHRNTSVLDKIANGAAITAALATLCYYGLTIF